MLLERDRSIIIGRQTWIIETVTSQAVRCLGPAPGSPLPALAYRVEVLLRSLIVFIYYRHSLLTPPQPPFSLPPPYYAYVSQETPRLLRHNSTNIRNSDNDL